MKKVLIACVSGLAACAGLDPSTEPSLLAITSIDTVISTESAAVAHVFDLDVSPSGELWLADGQSDALVVVDPGSGDWRTIGGQGRGPGEFNGPSTVLALHDQVIVVDRGNGRVQRLTTDGEFLRTAPLTPLVRTSFPHLLDDGGMLIGTLGRDSRLAVELDSAGEERRSIGTPVVEPHLRSDYVAIKAMIRQGQIPDDLRNQVTLTGTNDGDVWIVLNADAEVRRYGPEGDLRWATVLDEPEMSVSRHEFVRQNTESTNPNTYWPLVYVRDLAVAGQDLWILLDTPAEGPAVMIQLDSTGVKRRRVEVAGAGGAMAMALDISRRRLFLSTMYDAQVLMAVFPEGGAF
jgi:hypothetical protein